MKDEIRWIKLVQDEAQEFINFAQNIFPMDDNTLIEDKEFILKLREAVEKRVGRKMVSPRDFDYLTEQLNEFSKRVSPSTLKRIWGYNRDTSKDYKPYKYTLVSLVNILGYSSLEEFDKKYKKGDAESAEHLGETVMTENIMKGSVVELTWAPDRTCNLVCLGKGVFKVAHSQHGHLLPGDVVKFMSLTQNAPLYFNQVMRPGTKDPFTYTAGQRTGIHYRIRGIVNSEEDTIIS